VPRPSLPLKRKTCANYRSPVGGECPPWRYHKRGGYALVWLKAGQLVSRIACLEALYYFVISFWTADLQLQDQNFNCDRCPLV
jgi:hypothetical protein